MPPSWTVGTYVYCAAGHRSMIAASVPRAGSLAGGYDGWVSAGQPIEAAHPAHA